MTKNPATPSNRRMPPAERVARNKRIADARTAGDSWTSIAARERISVSTAQRAERDHLAVPAARPYPKSLSEIDIDALLVKIVSAHERALDRAAEMVGDADNDSARVGAMRAVSTLGGSLMAALSRAGILGDASLVAFAGEIQTASQVVLAFGKRAGLSYDEIDEVIRSLVPPRGGGGPVLTVEVSRTGEAVA